MWDSTLIRGLRQGGGHFAFEGIIQERTQNRGDMKYKTEYFFCSPKLLQSIDELEEVFFCVSNVKGKSAFDLVVDETKYEHQRAYNRAFGLQFKRLSNWKLQPLLHDNPRLIGDFQKMMFLLKFSLVIAQPFIEIITNFTTA